MFKPLFQSLALCCFAAFSAQAEEPETAAPVAKAEKVTLGWGRFFSNDGAGDGGDRWRTGSYAISRIRGESWSGSLPVQMGQLVELRLRADTIAPANLVTGAPDDRRYAGMIEVGLHTHFAWQGNEVSFGGGLSAIGPQTGVSNFQRWFHNKIGLPDATATDNQLGNQVFVMLQAELGHDFALGQNAHVRPFVEVQSGAETLVRVGGDLTLGTFGAGDLLVRDAATGHRYRTTRATRAKGVSVILGGDIAHVFDSALLPEGGNVTLSPERSRARLGLNWQGEKSSIFYGVTYLAPEFEEQPEGQVLGALNINLRF